MASCSGWTTAAEGRDWYVELDCEYRGDDAATLPTASCGNTSNTPCCHLAYVMENLLEGDSVILQQNSQMRTSHVTMVTILTMVTMLNSFTLRFPNHSD